MHFDASTIFVLVLTAAAILAIALVNIYAGRHPNAPLSSADSKNAVHSDKPLHSKRRRKRQSIRHRIRYTQRK